jgi:hypothetical protein
MKCQWCGSELYHRKCDHCGAENEVSFGFGGEIYATPNPTERTHGFMLGQIIYIVMLVGVLITALAMMYPG